jgi:adenylate cyclase
MNGLSASGLADLAGTTTAEVQRLVEFGVLVARDGTDPFLETDVQKVRLAAACEQAGLPMAGIASAIRAGRLSFAFLEAAPFRRWAVRSTRTYRQVSQETGVPLGTLGAVLESMGFARMGPDEPMREDELAVVPLLQLGLASGTFDLAWLTRLGRAHAEGLRLLATAWTEAYQARFEGPALESGADQRTAMELAGRRLPAAGGPGAAGHLPPPARAGVDRASRRAHRERARGGRLLGRAERVPAMPFLAWWAIPT